MSAASSLAQPPQAYSTVFPGASARASFAASQTLAGDIRHGSRPQVFVYGTEVASSGGALRAIALPASLQPEVSCSAAVVRGTPDPALAGEYVDSLAVGPARHHLRQLGLSMPPAS
ncbi:MAG TPA: hypothetical protein VHX88_01065 [Solirubrobacteraceae bacterium]|nr:hypothetical protein [Solirubrobacteraceae bacterium]